MSFTLDRRGGAEVLTKLAAAPVNAVAREVGNHAGESAEIDEYTTDRAAAAVSAPADQQAKDGVLTRAALAAGLQVHTR